MILLDGTMKTLEDFTKFYNTTLLADLKALEHERRKIISKLIFVMIAILCILGVLLILRANLRATFYSHRNPT